MKKMFLKYIGQVLVIVTIIAAALFGYSKWRDSHEEKKYAYLIGTQTKYEQLTKYTAKLKSDYMDQKDLRALAKRRFEEVNRDKDEKIRLLSDATYLIGRHVEKQDGPDYYFETKRATRNYVLNELRLAGKNSPPIGYILIKSNGKTYKRNYKLEFRVESLQTIDEKTGRINVYTKAFLISKEKSPLAKRVEDYKDWKEVKYPLEITGGTSFIDPTRPAESDQWFLWSPHLNGGFSMHVGGQEQFRTSIDLSTSGYGKSKNNLDWKLLHLGLDTDTDMDNVGFHVIPFSYRFYKPWLPNSYLGPGVGWNSDGVNYFLNMNVSF